MDSESQEPRDLIRQAFAMARGSGKADWGRMTVAVLKNRLLVLTRGQFSEKDYGVSSMREFVERCRDVVTIDTSARPPLVMLQEKAEQSVEAAIQQPLPEFQTVRPDLWRAVMDFRSGRRYVWDAESQVAREAKPDDTEGLALPSVTKEELASWRHEFFDRYKDGLGGSELEQASRWKELGLSTRMLPRTLRGPWNGEMKTRVADRLRVWFSEHDLPPPVDFVLRQPYPGAGAPLDELRSMVIECIRSMTGRELHQLQLPATALLRTAAKRDGRHRG